MASTGEWLLYTAHITDWGPLALGDPLELRLDYAVDGANKERVFLDDFRFQPYQSEGACYVYDVRTLRLLAQFDSQHFATMYQYNNEGQLVRTTIETERGLKTVTESQYNPKRKARVN